MTLCTSFKSSHSGYNCIIQIVWAGWLPGNPEALARLCAQGSHYFLQGSGDEPASATPGGGRPSPSFALSHPSLEMVRRPDTKLQDLRSALCLLWRPAEGEGRLQAEDGPLDSVPCPFRLRAHSTRSVSSSWALAHGAMLSDICRAAGCATPNTFARF